MALDHVTRAVFKRHEDKLIGHAMAEHCDKRINAARKAIKREHKYLLKVVRAKNTGGIMAGDLEGVFRRIETALDPIQKS